MLIYIVVYRHHINSMLKWRESNQSVELMAIREVHLNMELNNNTCSTDNLVRVLWAASSYRPIRFIFIINVFIEV